MISVIDASVNFPSRICMFAVSLVMFLLHVESSVGMQTNFKDFKYVGYTEQNRCPERDKLLRVLELASVVSYTD